MFEYNARTETINGARFIEKDVILFDYQYSGDILLRADVNLKSSGFGFVIAEDEGEAISRSANIYLLKLNSNDSYQVIYKSGTEQETILNQHVGSATSVYGDENVILFFRKQEERLIITKAIPLSDVSEVRFEEIELLQYVMPHDMENFKIGIYSNGGNTVRYAAVSTEAPSNWITNVRSANGGRIRWIKNGFIIEEAEYDIEAEAENIQLEAGTYYFDYKTDNPDMKAYVFESYLHNTGVKRSTKEIVDTSVDEEKNILREDGSFLLTEDHAVNIRFKAKWGKVTEICVKTIKQSGFVETDYNTTVRPPSRLVFDLRKIKKIRLTGTVNSAPDYNLENYYLVQRGTREIRLNTEIRPGEENTFEFIADTSELFLNGEPYRTLLSADNILSMFYNVDADIRELTVTTASGEEVNIIQGANYNENMPDTCIVTVIATGLDAVPIAAGAPRQGVAPKPAFVNPVARTGQPQAAPHMPVNSSMGTAPIPRGTQNFQSAPIRSNVQQQELVIPSFLTRNKDE